VSSGRSPGSGARVLLYAWLTVVLVFVYWHYREAGATESRMQTHASLVDGSVGSPFVYRVLAPAVAEAGIRALRGAVGERRAFHLAYLGWNLFWAFLTFVLSERFFRRWHASPTALVGSLLMGVSLLVAFADPPYASWSVAEVPLFLAGVLAFLEGRAALALVVVAVATLNRETALFIPLAWGALLLPGVERISAGFGRPFTSRLAGSSAPAHARWVLPAAGLVTWAAIYGGIRAVRGARPPFGSAGDLLAFNLQPRTLMFALIMGALLLGPFWWLWARGWKSADFELRRLALICLPIFALYLRFALWREVRVLLPVVPILLALGLHAVPLDPRSSTPDGDQ
jgi:hypothetical protein